MQLTGNNFVLRRWKIDDASSLQKNADDRSVSAMLLDRFPYPYTIEDAKYFISIKINEEPITNFAIDIGGEVVGVISVDMRPIFTVKPHCWATGLARHIAARE